MRFLIKEHKELTELIKKSGKSVDDFQFIKKKGWVYAYYQENYFKFHRKKEKQLNANLQWVDFVEYRFCTNQSLVSKDEKFSTSSDWQELLKAFGNWLKGDLR